ncbi:YCF48-related protein [Thalassotalea sp. G2M2-11]|uniref:WD40/YVTN/BNR-like repeat-containing protein n=1 Tax=Thalassotalea sp. G2M2-11 TaxID=2787627 RepID=UPI0019D232D6|nr:YCF48-related protein [Thalassotalea sp. G2M2-11]
MRKSKILVFSLLSLCISFIAVAKQTVSIPQWQHTSITGEPSLRGSAMIADSLWVTGIDNSVFVSQDGGLTWSNKSVVHSLITDFRDIALFDSQTAIVMGVGSGQQSVLFKTQDGGNTWQLIYQNTDKQGFFDSIAFWDEAKGLLLGDPVDGYYVVKKTLDGGKTWRRISQDNLPVILDKEAAFAASGNTLIVGKNGNAWITTGGFAASVYESDDFGETWQRMSVPLYQQTQTAGGYGLALNHHSQLFVLGGDYQQRRAKYPNMATKIAGKWQKVNSGEHGLRTAMACQGAICIATGKTGNDISFDHGLTWQKLSNNTKVEDKGFYTLAADDDKFLFAGAKGQVAVLNFSTK